MDISVNHFSPLADAVIGVFEKKEVSNNEPKIVVNRFLSEIVSWYEKLRNAMDIRDDEVVLKSAIERILKRRTLLGGNGKRTAEPLLRELIWAHYFPNNTLPESMIDKIAVSIDLHLALRNYLLKNKVLNESTLNEWILQLTSCDISRLLSPNTEKQAMSNLMFHVMKDLVVIQDDAEDTKNVQVYLAVRRAFAKDDVAFLRYYLFQQIFGQLTQENLAKVCSSFIKGYREIEYQMTYPLREKIFVFMKKRVAIFFILEDVFRQNKGTIKILLQDSEKLKAEVFAACNARYKSVRSKVNRAIVRSVIFLIVTKAVFAFGVEGTYEKWRYGHFMWETLGINMGIPPLLMIVASLFIQTPGKDNSQRIFDKISMVLFESEPKIIPPLKLFVHPPKKKSLLPIIFGFLGLLAFVVSFGLVISILRDLHFDTVSQAIFLFFLTVVSFLSYRINLTAHSYSVDEKQGLLTPFVDFLIIPIVRVGMYLTEGISQVNFVIFIFDFLIEAPLKALFMFSEQFFSYMHARRDDLE
ncbi:MAG TPA: hypothetical protein VGT05_04565 [Patescibacteria group bacterium]|nr:hypothetical protein [Patescibacteria group bacterium]